MNLPLWFNGVKSHFLTLAGLLPVVLLAAAPPAPCAALPTGFVTAPLPALLPGTCKECQAATPAPLRASFPPGVVINEIMADPTPVVGLPDAEWIELFNAGTATVSLKGWELTAGTFRRTLPDSLLHPGEHRVICSQATAPALALLTGVIILPSFPALRNSGNRITLSWPDGTMSDKIDYSDTWYGDSKKKNGGWSLERIDPLRDCGQKANWCASRDPAGGTPGKPNSVKAPNADHTPPVITSVLTLTPLSAEITFSETMDTLGLRDPANYHFPEEWGATAITILDQGLSVSISWSHPLPQNRPFSLRLSGLADECGNPPAGDLVEIVWVVATPGDVIINEILFNPFGGGNDFVELLNLSEKKIAGNLLVLAARDDAGALKKVVSLSEAAMVMDPGEIMAVTTDTGGIFPFYPLASRSRVREVSALPPMVNDRGCVVLLNDSMVVLDEVVYDEQMHHPLLASVEGVSLERGDPRRPAASRDNWHSAAENDGFATPGHPNSSGAQESLHEKVEVTFGQTAFSPNYDGYNDELIISCRTNQPGWLANCLIYDIHGMLAHRLTNNLLLGSQELITWNGRDETGSLFPAGPYVVVVQLFHPDGSTLQHKKAVFLTARGE